MGYHRRPRQPAGPHAELRPHGPRRDAPGPRLHAYTENYLYDLEHDPYELDNLAGYKSHRALSDTLMVRLVERMVEAGEAAPEIAPAPPRPSSRRRVTDA